ncbi:HU family DNA-binding protein [Deinococcus sonorensis]|uniref:HU family DNA-binding protein n=2 Tax=Deinococcus sonorensis TaxID=309891 RepID=A0ABV8YAG9_9DEIO
MTKARRKAKNAASSPAMKRVQPEQASQSAAETAEKVGKTGIVDRMVEGGAVTRSQAASVLDAAVEVIVNALRTGKTVGLPGLGTLSVKATAARIGVRPGTSDRIEIPAGKKVSIKVAADLKKNL